MSVLKFLWFSVFTQPWFASLVVGPLVGWLVNKFLNSNAKLKHDLMNIMLTIEKLYPDWSGEDKKKRAIEWLNQKNPLAYKLDNKYLETILEAVIKEVKEGMQEEEYGTEEN